MELTALMKQVKISKKLSLSKTQTPFMESQVGEYIYSNATHLLGFGFDGTACFRKGTRLGPSALREVSDGIETYSPYLDLDIEDISFYDLGDLKVDNQDHSSWKSATDSYLDIFSTISLKDNGVKTLVIGGEHSISYAPIKTYLDQYDELVLIHLDAHADLRDGYEGHHFSHASIIRRALDHFKESHQLIQYGIRSGTKDEYRWMNDNDTIARSRGEFLKKVEAIANDRPIYLTLDLDYFDPSFFPGTGTPEPGGEDFHSFIKLLKILQTKNFVGCDVVELAPQIDSTGNSSVFAAKVVRELILALE